MAKHEFVAEKNCLGELYGTSRALFASGRDVPAEVAAGRHPEGAWRESPRTDGRQETELGRPLNEEEVAAILKRHGHPMFVAARYRQTRQLIGSTLFPVYWFAVKIILAFVGLGYAVSPLVLIARGKSLLEVIGAVFSYAAAVLPTFAVVTIIFPVLDISNSKFRLLERATKE
jgi:hypothetical protein